MNTTNPFLGTRTLVLFSILALAASPIACVAATGTADDGAEPSASAVPGDRAALDTTDSDAAPTDEANGQLPDPTMGSPGSDPTYRGGVRQK